MKPGRKAPQKTSPALPKPGVADASLRLGAGRLRLYRLIAAVGLPLMLLGGAEMGLRLGGYGFSPRFFQELIIQGKKHFADNPKFSHRFFPPRLARITTPVTFTAEKPAGMTRIFIFGESAALGDPRPAFGAGRYLEALLRLKYPNRDFEVVNTSMTAINSHVIREIAEDCQDKQGDIWLVYMGNNEMVGPYGAATVFGPQAPPLWRVRLVTQLQGWRLGQLLMSAGRKLKAGEPGEGPWRGMQMFLENQVPADDPRRTRVYDSYRRNLEAVVASGRKAGAKVILSTVAVNTRDCPPFAGIVSNRLASAELGDLHGVLSRAARAENAADWGAAREEYTAALGRFGTVAELHYRLGQVLWRAKEIIRARQELDLARDKDALPFRADSLINRAVSEVAMEAATGGALLCDAAAALANAGGAGAGEESFFEHVHLNFEGNYRLGMVWANAVEKMLPDSVKQQGEWAPRETCEAMLGLTDWNRESVLLEVLDRFDVPPLSTQSNNAERVERLKEWLGRLERRTQAESRAAAKAIYETAIARAPADYRLRENFAEFLEEIGDGTRAIAERKAVRDLTPHYYFSHYILGKLLKQQKQFAEARECLSKAHALNPNQPDVLMELGNVEALEGHWEESLAQFKRALRLSPDTPRLHQLSADVLWRMDRKAEAIEALRQAVAIRPAYPEARYRLGEMLGLSGDVAAAAKEFAEVVRLRPAHVKAHVNLGIALAQLGRTAEAIREFDEALRLDPGNAVARQYRQVAEKDAQR